MGSRSYKDRSQPNVLERAITEGDNPVGEKTRSSESDTQVPRDTRNPVGIREDHLPRLNTNLQPIVNQYREGKVKRTPVRGVKQYLKPYAYKQWEPGQPGDRVPFA